MRGRCVMLAFKIEHHIDTAKADDVSRAQQGSPARFLIDQDAIPAVEVFDNIDAADAVDEGMPAADLLVDDDQIVGVAATDDERETWMSQPAARSCPDR